MEHDPRVIELLLLWEAKREQGESVSLEELCSECHELIPGLQRAVARHLEMDDFLGAVFKRRHPEPDVPDVLEPDALEYFRAYANKQVCAFEVYDVSGPRRNLKLIGYDWPIILQEGAEIYADCQFIEPIGHGWFGEVWAAKGGLSAQIRRYLAMADSLPHHPNTGLKHQYIRCPERFPQRSKKPISEQQPLTAIKFVSRDDITCAREYYAASSMADLRHPNLLPILCIMRSIKPSWLIIESELAERTLADVLSDEQTKGGDGIPRDKLMRYAQDAAEGIDFLNEHGYLHRDVKPHNLFLVKDAVKVGDFGLFGAIDSQSISGGSGLTPAYAAPEFLRGESAPTSDQYCLGVTLCELLTGKLPFSEEQFEERLTQPPNLDMLPTAERAILTRALAVDPAQRWPDCRTFVRTLAATMP